MAVLTVKPNGRRPQRADPRQEQAAGGTLPYYAAYFNGLRSLPHALDDLARDFGDDIYARMMLDPQVNGDVETLKAAILAQGVTLSPSVDDTDPRYEQAVEITRFCETNLANLQESLNDVLWDLLDSVMFGSRAAEIVYRDAESDEVSEFPGLKGNALFLRALKPKARRVLSYVVDRYFNFLGLLAISPERPFGTLSAAFLTEDSPEILPRERFFVMTWKPKNGDPRGTSQGRAVYDAWLRKLQILGEYLKYLAQFADPSIIALLEPEEDGGGLEAETDFSGEIQYDEETGEPKIPTRAETTVVTLKQVKGGSVGALTHVKELVIVSMSGEGQAFIAKIAECNREISKGILGSTLATNEGEHNARAAASVAQDVMALPVAYGKRLVAEALHDDVLRWLVEYNYGPQAKALVPVVTLSPTEAQDQPDAWQAAAKVAGSPLWNSINRQKAVVKVGFEYQEHEDETPPALANENEGEDPEDDGRRDDDEETS